MTNRHWLLISATVSCLMAVLMPSAETLWTDEAQTWSHVIAPSIPAMYRNLAGNIYSEALMPAAMLVAWVFAKLLGTSEWALRAPNILWTIIGVLAFARLGRLWKAPWIPLLFAVQPFVWFYANEARPYALQIAVGAWILVTLIEVLESRELTQRRWLVLLLACLFLISLTLFGVIMVAAIVLVCLHYGFRQRWSLPAGWKFSLASSTLLVCGLGVYYLWTLQRGAAGTKIWSPGLSNVAFALYEFGGFAGFGPGRDQLRELVRSTGISGVVKHLISALLPMGLLGCCYLACGWQLLRTCGADRRRAALIGLFVLVFVIGATAALSMIAKFPFWGRHLAPAFPALVVLLSQALITLFQSPLRVFRLAGIALPLLLLASSLQLRTAERHRKDDYRSAAAIAREAIGDGKSTWWAADAEAVRYYKVAPPETNQSGLLQVVTNYNVEELTSGKPPRVLVFSKPDVYDNTGRIRQLLEGGQFELVAQPKAFTVWHYRGTVSDAP